MAVVPFFRVLRNVNDRERDGGDVAVFDVNIRPLEFVPMVHGAVGVADEILRRVVGEAAEFPIVDPIDRGQVIRFALVPVIDDDVVKAAAEPDDRILERVQFHLRQARQIRINAGPLHRVRPEDAALADHDRTGARHDFKISIRPHHHADIRHPAEICELARRDCDLAEMLPRAVERL